MRTRALCVLFLILATPLASASEVGFKQENALDGQGLNIQAGEVSPGG